MTKDEMFEAEGIARNWSLIVAFVAEWLNVKADGESHPLDADLIRSLGSQWQQEMDS